MILPLLLLIVVLALDFGRVFYGYVTVTNATRIGANYAASHPTAWGTPGNAAERAEYQQLILRDTNTANCNLVGGTPPVPTFADGSDTGTTPNDVGDRVDVGLSCVFKPLTPIVGAIVGSNLVLSANSDFAVRAGKILGVPIAPAPTPGPTPAPTPTPGPTPTPTPCANPTVSFTATSNANGGHPHRMNMNGSINPNTSGWTWTWSGAVNPSQSGQNLTNWDFPATGAVSVTLTVTKGACVASVTQSVNVP